MFETPTIDIQELRSVLTDAGHTAVGFATMAAKKVNDVRLDLSDRYEEQSKDLRSNLLDAVEKFADVRAKVESTIDPVIESFAERLPAPARKVVENVTDAAKEAQNKAHKFVVDALTVDAAAPAPAAKPAAPKTTAATKTATPAAVKTAKTAKPVTKKAPAAKKATAKKAASAKPAAKRAAAKATKAA